MRRAFIPLLLATTALTMPAAFANSNAGSKVYVCATPQPLDLSQGDYEGLVWVEIGGLGNHGETGSTTNILTYDTWNTKVVQKAKGLTNAGDPEIEVARDPFNAGQNVLRDAAQTNFNYAFKMVRNDAVDVGGTPTILYNRGLVTGPRHPWGRNEDFDLEIFTIALQQEEITVNPTLAGTAPENTAIPLITGTTEDSETLTVSNGTFTGGSLTYEYRWYRGGVPIADATKSTYNLVTDDVGKLISARVIARNASGSAVAFAEAVGPIT